MSYISELTHFESRMIASQNLKDIKSNSLTQKEYIGACITFCCEIERCNIIIRRGINITLFDRIILTYKDASEDKWNIKIDEKVISFKDFRKEINGQCKKYFK